MLSHGAALRNQSQVDLLSELRLFISGATNQVKCSSSDLMKTSMFLLKSLPAARYAVLEYLRNVFDAAALNYILRIETEITTGKLPPPSEYDETTLTDVYTVLCGFVSNNAEAWAPIISTWSLELLGEISSRYAGRAHICSGLNETLQLWMNCRATRTLIDITTQCLSCLMHSNTEACINALLDTSVKHSPNFDWVVAHVGSCFPQTVIVRVLSCGLKDFCQNKSYQQGCESPKLKSVVGILGHLATSHAADIQKALLNLFNWSLLETPFHEGDVVRMQRKATVPFLLQLLSLSSTLLNAISDDVRTTIPVNVILTLYNLTDDWCKYFGSPEALKELLVNLVLKCEKGGAQIISLLLECTFLKPSMNETDENKISTITTNSSEVLECILEEIDYSVRYQSHSNKTTVNLLNSLIYDIEEVYEILLSPEGLKSQTAARIITFIGQNNPSILIQALSFLFQNGKHGDHLALFVRIISNELINKSSSPYKEKGGHFAVMLEQILDKYYIKMDGVTNANGNVQDFDQMWENLLTLLRWEKSEKIFVLKSRCISKGIETNLVELTGVFKNDILNMKSFHVLCEILYLLEIPEANGNVPLQVLVNFINGAINYFFICCQETDEIVRLHGFCRIRAIFQRLSIHSKISRNLALRSLLERSLFSKDAEYFGAKPKNDYNTSEHNKQLIIQNKKISKTIHLTKHSSVFNGGIIGNGKRKSISSWHPHTDFVPANTEQLISIIKACCATNEEAESNKTSDILLESITLVSLMLVQLVSPDVMYNGLPWPEEDFSKVTIERDLLIRRLFDSIPLLWDLLNFIGLYRPALCYCSVLIRALTATLMHQWTSMGDQSKSSGTESYKSLMNTTVKVIDVMALGQLLPPPLSSIRDIVPFLNSYEIVAILRECIWFYMRDHIPSPALFGIDNNGLHWRDPTVVRPADVYTKTLRIIMQRNIKTVGHLYSQMFITIPKNE